MVPIDLWEVPETPPAPPGRGVLHLWKVDLERVTGDLVSVLSADEMQRCESMQPLVRDRFTAARGMLRRVLGSYLQVSPGEIAFEYSKMGKPALNRPGTPLQFNLSHSDRLALIAVTWDLAVGVDLERLEPRESHRRIARRLFSQQIIDRLEPLGGSGYTREFLVNWTSLEARVKVRGQGVFSGLAHPEEVECSCFEPEPGWVASVAMPQLLPPSHLWRCFCPAPE